MNNPCFKIIYIVSLLFLSAVANAIPVLQIGPSDFNTAQYNLVTESWDIDSDGNGGYRFNAYNTGKNGFITYLVFAAADHNTLDSFDITVTNDNVSLSLYAEGYGAPVFEDPNSLASHGIYDTWSEVYQLVFNGSQGIIPNTQPGDNGSGLGYVETIFVEASLMPGLSGIHVDMFSANFAATRAKDIVTGFAPFSHDAELHAESTVVPVPAALWLFGSGLIGLAGVARRRVCA